jgi:hypothetical protein
MFKKYLPAVNNVGKLVVGVASYAAVATVFIVAANRVAAAILEE